MSCQKITQAVGFRLTLKEKTKKWAMVSAAAVLITTLTPAKAADPVTGYSSGGQTVVRHGDFQRGGAHIVKIGFNKSVVVDLPRDTKDVMVANPDIANAVIRTPRRAYIFGTRIGGTSVFFFDEMGQQIAVLDVQVERDVASLGDAIRRIMPTANVQVESLGDNVILTGTVQNASEARAVVDMAARFAQSDERVVNQLQITAEDQVNLRVLVAEMRRDIVKQLGIDLGGSAQIGKTVLSSLAVNPFSFGTPNSVYSGLVNGSGVNSFGFDVNALEKTGLLRTLAEPNLTAISGEKASFLAGGEFAIPVSAEDNKVTVDYKKYGVSLDFIPYVVDESRINLKIETEVSEITSSGGVTLGTGNNVNLNVPGLSTRRASTTVEVPAGGSLVMAGLLQRSIRQEINGTPGLKNIPVLGALFRSREFQNNETELAIIVTPHIVRATARANLALPTDGYVPANDADSYLLGRFNKLYGVNKSADGQKMNGKWGHIIK